MNIDIRPDASTDLEVENLSSANALKVFRVDENRLPVFERDPCEYFAVAGVWAREHSVHFRLVAFFTKKSYAFRFAHCMHDNVSPNLAGDDLVQDIRSEMGLLRLEFIKEGDCYDA